MQLFSVEANLFKSKKKKIAHENMKKSPSKVAHNRPQSFFSVLTTGQKLPKSHILFHKNGSLYDFYLMTLHMSIDS